MSLIDIVKEAFRTELPVRQEILDREIKFNKQDPNREKWILRRIYLIAGGLEKLKKHPNYTVGNEYELTDEPIVHYESLTKDPAKKVIVSVPFSEIASELIEKKLKLDLNSRKCNAGVFYKTYQKKNVLYAEAVPARISEEP